MASDGWRIMVTGGSGLAGQGLKKWSEANGREGDKWIFLSSKDGDLRNMDETKKLFELHQPTHVVHFAAFVGGLFANMKYKVEFYRHNSNMNDNIMWCCKEFEVTKLVSCLSTCIFPDKTTYPIDETMLHNGPPHDSNAPYAYSKRMIDVLNRAYKEEYDCNFTSVIPTNLFGPHDNFNLENGHVLPALIHKLYLAKKNNTDFVVWGSGKPLRQFLYSEDFGALVGWTLMKYDSNEPIILSVDEEDEISIGDVAKLVAEKMNFTGNIVSDTTKADGQYKKTACNKKLRGLYPEFKFTPIEEAIEKSVNWFIENYETCRK